MKNNSHGGNIYKKAKELGMDENKILDDYIESIGKTQEEFTNEASSYTDEQIKEMADSCARASGGHKGSAKDLYPEDMIAIYRMANQE